MEKIKVALVFGGRSAEHEISLRSTQNVIEAIDRKKYAISLIAIDKKGGWYTRAGAQIEDIRFPLSLDQFTDPVSLCFDREYKLSVPSKGNMSIPVDVFFPILHGPFGEDGTIQGLFRMMNVPFVGSGVLGSAVGMDKDVMKRLLRDGGIPIGKYISAYRKDVPSFEIASSHLGLPIYVKPANMGSSVGISKVSTAGEYKEAVELAFRYDQKILFEENINGLEIECAVLGNRDPKASEVGRIISYHSFYTYSSKYLDDKGFKIEIPAAIGKEARQAIRSMAVRVFKVLEAEGLGRVDVFLKDDGQVIVNEINTMPGFTSISMYPMLWKESGISYPALIDQLIDLAFERQKQLDQLETSI